MRRPCHPRHRKGERKVGGAKHRHRPDGPLHHAQLWPRGGLTVGQGGIMAAVQIVALEDVVGKQLQLPGGASTLAIQPRLGQAGFLRADFGDGIATDVDFRGNRLQQAGAIPARRRRRTRTPLRPRHRRVPPDRGCRPNIHEPDHARGPRQSVPRSQPFRQRSSVRRGVCVSCVSVLCSCAMRRISPGFPRRSGDRGR